MKYLEQQNSPNRVVPESAASVFQQNETYRKYLQNLDVTVTLYNQVRETILDVEYPLIEHQLRDIDQELEKAITQLNWTSEGNDIDDASSRSHYACITSDMIVKNYPKAPLVDSLAS